MGRLHKTQQHTVNMEGDMELEMHTMLPMVKESEKLEELAFVLTLEIPEAMLGDGRRIYRLVNHFINSDPFDELPTKNEIITRVHRMLKQYLFPQLQVAEHPLVEENVAEDIPFPVEQIEVPGGGHNLVNVADDVLAGNVGDNVNVDGDGVNNEMLMNVLNPRIPDQMMQPLNRFATPVVRLPAPMNPTVVNMRQRVPTLLRADIHRFPIRHPPDLNRYAAPTINHPLRPHPFQNSQNIHRENPFSQQMNNPLVSSLHDPRANLIDQFDPISRQSGKIVGRLSEKLKIGGQIGNPGEKDKLSFDSLWHQILNARDRHISDATICAAVITQITPDLPLRGYLESMSSLTLSSLLTTLKIHFRVKDATAAFNELSNEAQKPEEGELAFCMRLMQLRQKVLMLTWEEGGQYPPELVQKQFQHVLSVGLKREAVRQELRATLKIPNLDDATLLKEISDVVMNESEHEKKVVSSQKKATVSAVTFEEMKKSEEAPHDRTELLLEEMRKLTAQVGQLSGLQSDVERLKVELRQQQYQQYPQQSHIQQHPQYPQQQQSHTQQHPQYPQQQQNSTAACPPVSGNPYANLSSANVQNGVFHGSSSRGRGGVGRGSSRGGYRGARSTRCYKCNKTAENGERLQNHCFFCCEEGHTSAVCPAKNSRGPHL